MYHSAIVMNEGAKPSFERPIDLVHLARQTLGDRGLEREVLDLFVVQCRSVIARLEAITEEPARRDLAHTIKGSARSVGAWRVAEAAEACESALNGMEVSWSSAMDKLVCSVREACLSIAEIRGTA
jgi:HPt (histidine-containing phosphotransfer) domain-containing protein